MGAALAAIAAIGGSALIRSGTTPTTAAPAPRLVPRPLANDAGGQFNPSLSPDGMRVVYDRYHDRRRVLYVRETDTGETHRLALDGEVAFQETKRAKWSPRGDVIAFLATEGAQTNGLYVVAPAGGQPRRLTTMAGIGLCWHPDGRSIGFVDREGLGAPFSIYSVSIESNTRRRLTQPPSSAFGDTHCAFSPDGREIAVERHETRSASDLFVVAVENPSLFRRLTHGQLGMDGIAWSPDERSIVFGSPKGLWQVSPREGASQVPSLITGSEGTVLSPSFSSPGRGGVARLAYQYQLYDVNVWRWDRAADGRNHKVQRLPGSTVWDSFPAVSADGRRIAYVSNRKGENAIWVALGDGTDARPVSGPFGTVFSPRWSPDGRRLAFSGQTDGNWDVYVVDAGGSNRTRLTSDSSQEENPTWSSDGRWIYFRSDRSGTGQIWKVSSTGGSPVCLTRGPASQALDSLDGGLLYFVRRDDMPGLWSMPVGGGPETLVLAGVRHDLWAVTHDGIAFLDGSIGGPLLQFFSFATRTVSTLAALPKGGFLPGFAMTPDARTALWVRVDASQNDLMVIDRWHQD